MNTNETLIIMGRSGSGKGTQVKLLKEYLQKHHFNHDLFHFESGDHFRNFITEEGYTSEIMKNIIAQGTLAPDFITEWLLVDSFVKHMRQDDQLIILDGFPRTLNQAMTLDSAMDYYKRDNIKVIHINVSEAEVRLRMSERGRNDDRSQEVIDSRIEWYNENVVPTIEYLRSQDQYIIMDVDGEQSIEKVHQDIINSLKLTSN